jgi:hypothetical protein
MYGKFTYPTLSVERTTRSEGGERKTHETARNVRSADVQISADAEKRPVDDRIREKHRCRFVIFAVDGHRHPMLGCVCGGAGACTCVAVAAFTHGSLLPAEIGR